MSSRAAKNWNFTSWRSYINYKVDISHTVRKLIFETLLFNYFDLDSDGPEDSVQLCWIVEECLSNWLIDWVIGALEQNIQQTADNTLSQINICICNVYYIDKVGKLVDEDIILKPCHVKTGTRTNRKRFETVNTTFIDYMWATQSTFYLVNGIKVKVILPLRYLSFSVWRFLNKWYSALKQRSISFCIVKVDINFPRYCPSLSQSLTAIAVIKETW